MSLQKLIYTKNWEDPRDFPTIETSEAQVRADIQDLYDQVKVAFNDLVDKLTSTTPGDSGADQIGMAPIPGFEGDTLTEMLEEAGHMADEAKEAAEAAADDAEDSAILSESYAKGGTDTRSGEDTDNSKYYKEQAASSANTASGYADDARGYKNDASGYANDALGYKNDASGYANTALGYKNDASNSANAAASSASTASGYANTALGYKNAASSSADAAAASAQEAAGYIEGSDVTDAVRWDVTQSLTDAGKDRARKNIGIKGLSANKSATAGSVVAFSDGADNIPLKDLKVNLAINQPLHGQANPYPAGGGKNILPANIVGDLDSYLWNGVTMSITNQQFKLVGTATANGGRNALKTKTFTLPAGTYTFSWTTAADNLTAFITNATTLAAIASPSVTGTEFTLDEATDVWFGFNIVNGATYNATVGVQIESGSTKTDWTPYSNVCPIYPVTEAEVSVSAKNMLPLTVDLIKASNPTRTWTGNATTFAGITYTIQTDSTGKVTGITASGTATANADLAIPHGVVKSASVLNGCPSGGASGTYRLTAAGEGNDTGNGVNVSAGFDSTIYIRIANGQTVNLLFKPMLRLATETDVTFEPYAGQQYLVNIGINQFDKSTAVADSRWNTSGTIAASGTTRSAAIPIQPNTAYYFKNVHSASIMNPVWWLDSNQGIISSSHFNTATEGVATSPANAAYVGINFPSTNLDTAGVNYPSRFTSYYPYTGHTVYGGELDVTTGVLTARYKSVTWNGTETWGVTASGNYYRFQLSVSDIKSVGPSTTAAIIADKLATTIANEPYTVKQYNTLAWVIMPNTMSTVEQFKAWLAENPIQVVYELATPISIQLTPTEVDTLRGDNVIFCDAGDITNCEYRAEGLIDDTIAGELYGALRDTESESVTVDSALSATSENPVQNKVINTALGAKADLASPTFTGTPKAPTAGSSTNNTQIATTAFVQTLIAGRQAKAGTRTPSLTVAGWSSNTQTVSVSGVLSNNLIIVSPAPASAKAYADAGIICTAQASGTLTFTCETVPSVAIDLNVVIFN